MLPTQFPPMSAETTPHPLAEPFATALFAPVEPDPVDFVMLLTEVSQLSAADYATMWSDVVTIGRGTPVLGRERAAYALTATDRVAEAERLAGRLGEASPTLQILVIRALRLLLQKQRGRRSA